MDNLAKEVVDIPALCRLKQHHFSRLLGSTTTQALQEEGSEGSHWACLFHRHQWGWGFTLVQETGL